MNKQNAGSRYISNPREALEDYDFDPTVEVLMWEVNLTLFYGILTSFIELFFDLRFETSVFCSIFLAFPYGYASVHIMALGFDVVTWSFSKHWKFVRASTWGLIYLIIIYSVRYAEAWGLAPYLLNLIQCGLLFAHVKAIVKSLEPDMTKKRSFFGYLLGIMIIGHTQRILKAKFSL